MTVKFSIITVVYNNLDGLKRTAESVLGQTSSDYEWLVFDGGSTDGSKEYLEIVSPRVSYWESVRDNGIYDAMNKGIRKAQGEYLIFMNSGDCFADDGVLSRVSAVNTKAGVVYGDWLERQQGKDTLHRAPAKADFAFFCGDNICHQAMFIRSDLLKQSEYDLKIGLYADWAKWLEFAAGGVEFRYVPRPICVYELGGASWKLDPIAEKAKLFANVTAECRQRIFEVLFKEYDELIGENKRLRNMPLSEFLGIQNTKALPWGERLKYKLCKRLCKALQRASTH